MIFKTPQIEQQWMQAVKDGRAFVPIVAYAATISVQEIGKQPVLTEVLRTDEEHREMLAGLGRDYYPTVHSYWRAVDLRSSIYTPQEIERLVSAVNRMFAYGGGKKAAIFHNIGAGAHIHIQTPADTMQWRA